MLLRSVVLTAALVPYAVYAWRDHVVHLRARRVSLVEHGAHALIAVGIALLVGNAFYGARLAMACGAALVCLAGGVDEYVFHHDLPPAEVDLHAKGHFGLFMFVAAALCLDERTAFAHALEALL